MATKLVLLTKTDAVGFVPLPLEPPADNPLLLLAARSYENRDVIRRTLNPIHGCGVAGASSTVVESLVPKVIRLDAEGVPVTEHETASVAKVVDVEVIDWQRWKGSQITAQTITNAMSLFVPAYGSSTSKCPRSLWPFF